MQQTFPYNIVTTPIANISMVVSLFGGPVGLFLLRAQKLADRPMIYVFVYGPNVNSLNLSTAQPKGYYFIDITCPMK